MDFIKRYILPRLLQWVIVIFIGVTVIFLVPRLSPMDPIQSTMSRMTSVGTMNPEAVKDLKEVLRDLYGLEGGLFQQYINFWNRILHGSLGPSLTMFPTPVLKVISTSLPWTAGLMIVSIVLGWLLGIILGTLTGYFSDSKIVQALDTLIICVYPIPYYIMALLLIMIFCYIFPIFPLMGGAGIGMSFSWSWRFFFSIIKHGFLPAVSLIIINTGFRFITQKALASTIISSDYVNYAEAAAVPRGKIMFRYVLRNSLLPQVTDLALSLGRVFGGALITEFVFSYPGIGQVLYTAIMQSDFNLIMGITVFSVIAIATAALVVDLIYPLIDPRIRYK